MHTCVMDVGYLQIHEAQRVIGDRMWDPADRAWLHKQLEDRLSSMFSTSWRDLFELYGGECPPFVNFLRPGMDPPPYEPAADMPALKQFLSEKLEDYGMEPGFAAMDLVLFKDALLHLCRISRVLAQPRGNALLVGVGAELPVPALALLMHAQAPSPIALPVALTTDACQHALRLSALSCCHTHCLHVCRRVWAQEPGAPGNVRGRAAVLFDPDLAQLPHHRVPRGPEGTLQAGRLPEQAHDVPV
jgi:hypothetical protein